MQDFVQSGLAPLFVFVLVVTFHELGHFLAARWCGVQVKTFSVGFGPELFGFVDKHGTRWRLSAIPLGGYVAMAGDANAASMPQDQPPQAGSLHAASVWRRLFIVTAGPLASFLLAPLLFFIVAIGQGVPVSEPVVGKVMQDGAAFQAGMRQGDLILSVDGRELDNFDQLSTEVQNSQGRALSFEVYNKQDDSLRTLDIVPRLMQVSPDEQRYLIGIQRASEMQNPVQAGWAALTMSWRAYVLIPQAVGGWITGASSDQGEQGGVAGPIGIARMAADSAQQSWASLLIFTALLSVNLGFLNLLPIPILDGGHIVFLTIEAVRGRPVRAAIQMHFYRIGLALLLALFLYGTISDIIRW